MFIEIVKSTGLAHLSYLVGAGGQAAVIDPRRDCEIYVELAREHGTEITHVLETHRNEDLVSGAPILARMTGAAVLHGPNPAQPITFAKTVREGETLSLGQLRVRVLETPGHTDDSLSYAIFDDDFGDDAVGVFTGDALFIGDVGRTDFYPERSEEVAGLLFDSLQKLMGLGDQAIVYPAHGAGSVCGDNMADREFSTIGFERRNNPMLQINDRDAFIARKVGEHHYQPPYFRLMEHLNAVGAEPASRVLVPRAITPMEFSEATDSAVVVDVRSTAAYLGAHLPGSLAIPTDMLGAFAGWLLDPEQDILLVADSAAEAHLAATHLARIGYDRIKGFLTAQLPVWAAGGRPFRVLTVVDADEVARRVADDGDGWTLLDVRSAGETATGVIPGARQIYVGEVAQQLDTLDPARRYTVMCGSGARATVAASVLQRAGFDQIDVFMGSMGAWRAAQHPTVEA